MKDNKKLIIITSVILSLLVLLIGTAYAIFTYTRIGSTKNDLITGNIYMHYTETNELTIENAMPTNKYSSDNYFEFTIDGVNDSKKTIYYEIVLNNGLDSATRNIRLNPEFLRFRLVEVDNENKETELFNNRSYASLNNKRIWSDKIEASTNNTNKKYRLYMWISDTVKVCNQDLNDCNYYITGTNNNWNDVFASVRVDVNGDFTEKPVTYNTLVYEASYNGKGLLADIDGVEKTDISAIKFETLTNKEIEEQYNKATIKAINNNNNTNNKLSFLLNSKKANIKRLANETENEDIHYKKWIEEDTNNPGKYILHIASSETIYFPSDSSFMFRNYTNMKSIDLSNVNTSNVINMGYMFQQCSSLANLNLNNFDTSNVVNMTAMFMICLKLETINLNNFDTSNVINMSFMFMYCRALNNLNLKKFNTSNVVSMMQMFFECFNLSSLDVSNFNTSNVNIMTQMFTGVGLKSTANEVNIIGLKNFDTSKVTNMKNMFENGESYTGSGKLTNETLAGISNWDVSKVEEFTSMFYGQGKNLTTLDLSKWDTSSATSFNHMFTDCFVLESLDLSNWNTSNVLSMYNMFDDCYKLTTIGDVSSWNVTKLVDIGGFLNGCSSFTGINNKLDLSGWQTSSLRGAQEAFRGIKVSEIDISNWDTSKINSQKWEGAGNSDLFGNSIYYAYSTDMNIMFKDCTNLDVIYVGSGWVTSNTTTTDMFSGCKISSVTLKS